MARFKYQALLPGGSQQQGYIEAEDEREAASLLTRQGFRPLSLEPAREEGQGRRGLAAFSTLAGRNARLSQAEIDFFTSQLAMLLKAGLQLDTALKLLARHGNEEKLSRFCRELERKLKEGKPLSRALVDYPWFSPIYVNMVRAGEEGGMLPEMLERLSRYQEEMRELKQFVVSSSIYPAFLLVVGLAAILLLLGVILPRFEVVFAGLNQELPAHVRLLMQAARLVSGHPLATAAILLAPPLGLAIFLRTPEGRA